jgi:hypothetical protein
MTTDTPLQKISALSADIGTVTNADALAGVAAELSVAVDQLMSEGLYLVVLLWPDAPPEYHFFANRTEAFMLARAMVERADFSEGEQIDVLEIELPNLDAIRLDAEVVESPLS